MDIFLKAKAQTSSYQLKSLNIREDWATQIHAEISLAKSLLNMPSDVLETECVFDKHFFVDQTREDQQAVFGSVYLCSCKD